MTMINFRTYSYLYQVPAGNAQMKVLLGNGRDHYDNRVIWQPKNNEVFQIVNKPIATLSLNKPAGDYDLNEDIQFTANFDISIDTNFKPWLYLYPDKNAVKAMGPLKMNRINSRQYQLTYRIPQEHVKKAAKDVTITIKVANCKSLEGKTLDPSVRGKTKFHIQEIKLN